MVLVIGVNGVGKNNICRKTGWAVKGSGKKVILAAAGPILRAAAIRQLTEWSHRAGVRLCLKEGSDPAAVT